jgi:catechol 2,3-dioxygenase-like lactoylglutathione lyase family enzyme
MATALDGRLKAKAITPSLTVDDLQRSIRFFEGLGFVVDERWEDGGVLRGVMLNAGESRLGISQDDWQKGRAREKGVGMRLFIDTTQNIDELAANAVAAGIALDQEPHEMWGSRAFEVTEPSGFKLTITSERQ